MTKIFDEFLRSYILCRFQFVTYHDDGLKDLSSNQECLQMIAFGLKNVFAIFVGHLVVFDGIFWQMNNGKKSNLQTFHQSR